MGFILVLYSLQHVLQIIFMFASFTAKYFIDIFNCSLDECHGAMVTAHIQMLMYDNSCESCLVVGVLYHVSQYSCITSTYLYFLHLFCQQEMAVLSLNAYLHLWDIETFDQVMSEIFCYWQLSPYLLSESARL